VTAKLNDEWQEKLRIATSSHHIELEKELDTSRALRQKVAQEEDKARAASRQVAVVKEEMQILADRAAEGLKSEIGDGVTPPLSSDLRCDLMMFSCV
jgi:hypothetical protein